MIVFGIYVQKVNMFYLLKHKPDVLNLTSFNRVPTSFFLLKKHASFISKEFQYNIHFVWHYVIPFLKKMVEQKKTLKYCMHKALKHEVRKKYCIK